MCNYKFYTYRTRRGDFVPVRFLVLKDGATPDCAIDQLCYILQKEKMKTLINIDKETDIEVRTKNLEEFKIEDRKKGKKVLKISLEESIKERVCFFHFFS